MKKLLSLLSVLTISGTAAPITIAASPYYQKEKNKILNKLETLKIKNKIGVNLNDHIPDFICLNIRTRILNKNINIKKRNIRNAIWKNSSNLVKKNIPRKSIKVSRVSGSGAKIFFRVIIGEKIVYFADKYVPIFPRDKKI